MVAPAQPHVRATEIVKGKVVEVDQCAHCLTSYPCEHLQMKGRIADLEAQVRDLEERLEVHL